LGVARTNDPEGLGSGSDWRPADPLPIETRWLAGLALLSLVLKTLGFFHYRFDSDESQHLHVAWGWTAGLVQYRDLFDNHAPLFHLITAPILALVGERDDVLLYMRGPMIPLFAVVVGATYTLGRQAWSQRTGLWAAVLLMLCPPFFLKSLEYRTDNLWNALWLIALLLIAEVTFSRLDAFLAGLVLGCALAVSLKTPLLIVSALLAALEADFLLGRLPSWRGALSKAALAAAGFAIIPCAVLLLFWRLNALDVMYYCNIVFNELARGTRQHVWVLKALYPVELLAIHAIGRWWVRASRPRRTPLFFAMICAVFVTTLVSFWPLISTRDFLPILPLIFLSGVGALESAAVSRAFFSRYALHLLVAVALAQATVTWSWGALARNQTRTQIAMMHQVLTLTRPGEPIMDLKGETVYRSRPFYYIFEFITRAQFRAGLLDDTIPQAVVAANCHVAQADSDFFPKRGRRFLNENFLNLGRLRAAGQFLRSDGSFSIAIPGSYVVVDSGGIVRGRLDGTAMAGARYLAAGPHRFEGPAAGRLASVWAPAIERGFSPFHLRDRIE
jgi:hypothetical protein